LQEINKSGAIGTPTTYSYSPLNAFHHNFLNFCQLNCNLVMEINYLVERNIDLEFAIKSGQCGMWIAIGSANSHTHYRNTAKPISVLSDLNWASKQALSWFHLSYAIKIEFNSKSKLSTEGQRRNTPHPTVYKIYG